MANTDHVEWLKQGRAAWNSRRKLVRFSPDLAGVDFRGVLEELLIELHSDYFARFDLSGANLQGAKLKGLDFSRASFKESDLSDADLSSSIFTNVNFDKANLAGVTARKAFFQNSRFHQTIGAGEVLAQSYGTERPLDWELQSLDDAAEVLKEIDFSLDVGSESKMNDIAWGLSPRLPKAGFPKEPTYLVTFATNRKPAWSSEWLSFGAERDEVLHYGACRVHVPRSHKVGSLGSPLWKRLLKGDDRLKIRQLYELNGDLYWQLIKENFSELFSGTPPTVVVHGYNVGFEDAVLWAAQIGYDLGLMRGINLFSWPSRDVAHSYQADEATVDASKYHLASYLLDFIERAGGRKINVLAHSMGCRCLASALEIIGLRYPEKLARFNHLIFAAADVDQDAMRNIGSHIIANSGRTTSYVCSKDKAVHLSSIIHQFARVGFLPPVFLMDAVDTVEVEKGNLWELGHSYIAEAKELLMDMHQILRSSTPPEERFSIRSGASGHWILKD